jgi:exodeoxyribonuclease-3
MSGGYGRPASYDCSNPPRVVRHRTVPLKIATWNVNGIRKRQAEVQQWLEREQPDVACLQEIKAPASQIPPALCEIEGYWCYWHGEGGYSGVGLHVRRGSFPQPPEFSHPPFDLETRIVAARVGTLTVASIYVPNGGKDFPAKMKFLDALDAFAEGFRAAEAPVILCGDLNVARTERDVHPKERKPRAVGQLPEERALIERLISRGLVDVGRALDPDNDDLFTWWAPWRNMRQRNIGWRLDYVLASESIASKALSSTVGREFGTSDHGPVTSVFDVEPSAFAMPERPASAAVAEPPRQPPGRLF